MSEEETEDLGGKIYDMAENAANVLYPVFNMFGWEWLGKTPTRQNIIDNVKEYAYMAYDQAQKNGNKHGRISCGRIEVECKEGVFEVKLANIAHAYFDVDL